MKYIRILKSSNQYRYHATSKHELPFIEDNGLQPYEGQFGKAVYFARSEQGALDLAYETTGGNFLLRVKLSDLMTLDYQDFPDQGYTREVVPASMIEYKNIVNGKWYPLINQKFSDKPRFKVR